MAASAVLCERDHARVGDKPQDHVLEGLEAAGQPNRVGGGAAGPVLVDLQTLGGQGAVAAHQVGQDCRGKRGLPGGAGGLGGVAGLHQQLGHGVCPPLRTRLELIHITQVTQKVRTTPGVQRLGQMRIAAIAIPDDDPVIAGQHPARIDRLGGAVTDMQQGQIPGAGHMDVGQPARGPRRGLIHVQRRRVAQQRADVRHEVLQQPRGLAAHARHPALGHRQAGYLPQQPASTAHREEVRAGQVGRLRVRLRPVLRPTTGMRWRRSHTGGPARRADLRAHHVLRGHRWRRRAGLGHLPTLRRAHRHPGQVRAAAGTHPRPTLHAGGRLLHQPHRRSRRAGLLARSTLPALPQRPVGAFGLLGEDRIAAWRLGGGAGVLAPTALQLLHPRGQRGDLGFELADLGVLGLDDRRQLDHERT
jgi:hypothetical protein